MVKRKTWHEKLHDVKDLPSVGPIREKLAAKWGPGMMLVPSPLEVDAEMKRVPKGKTITINEIRATLAQKHNADFCCPMATGIFTWISANAAEEAALEGETNTTPFWRTLKTGGELNPKFPGGVERQRAMLEAEGHKVIQKGKRWVVASK
jgi:hypothetical protein